MLKKSLFLFLILVLITSFAFSQALVWNTTSTLPITVRDSAVIHYNGYVYSIGGRTTGEAAGTHAIDNVYYAAVNPNGSLGTWTATTSLPGKLACHAAYAYNDRLYVWGGWDENYVTMNTCYYAPINSGGSLGSWVTSSVTIPDSGTAQSQMDAFGRGVLGYNGTVYVMGGEINDASKVRNCYYSNIQPSGDYSSWVETTALPDQDSGGSPITGYWFHGSMIVEGDTETYIYMVGGNHSGTTEDHIIINTINTDGSLGASWTWASNFLITAAYEQGCAFDVDSIYSLGGLSAGTPIDSVQKCQVDPATGDIIAVTEETVMPEARARTEAVGYKVGPESYLLVVGGGGYYATDPLFDTCVYAQIPRVTRSPLWNIYE